MPEMQKLQRRFVIGGVAGVTMASAAHSARNPEGAVEVALEALSAALERMHGAGWRTVVDHDNGFVMLIADRSQGRPAT